MAIEPWWGVLIGLGIAPLIKMFRDSRKAKKLSTENQCPTCRSALVDKPFTTTTLRVCPQKHGYLTGNHQWMTAKTIERTTRGFRDAPFEDLPQESILFWSMYHVLFSDGPVDTSPVDNVPGRKKPG